MTNAELADELERELDSKAPFSLSMTTGRQIVSALRAAQAMQDLYDNARMVCRKAPANAKDDA